MKSGSEASFYLPGATPESWISTPATAGPWGPQAQHGGPPSGLLTRALESLIEPGQTLGRISIDLLGPVPVGPLATTASVIRKGRSVSLLTASLLDTHAGRECATARAWVMPGGDGPGSVSPLPHKPDDGGWAPLPESWHGGYIDHVEWRWVAGTVVEPGPATVWMRPIVPLVPDEELSGMQLLMTCIDSASGMSSMLDPTEWGFLNTDLTVHIVREPVGDWVCIDAETSLTGTGVGMTTATAYDERGLVARSAQALVIQGRQSATK